VALPWSQRAISAPRAVTEVVGRARGEAGRIDVLINNAATVQRLECSPSMDPGSWAASLDINVVAPARPGS
jgi:NAD(P)-dependent dehydrogenase (short-subunit alcohol dehydrogenase family)